MIYIMVVGVKAYDGQRQQVSFQTGKLPQLAQYTEAPAVSQSDKLQHDPSLTSVMFGFLDWSSLLVGTLGPGARQRFPQQMRTLDICHRPHGSGRLTLKDIGFSFGSGAETD